MTTRPPRTPPCRPAFAALLAAACLTGGPAVAQTPAASVRPHEAAEPRDARAPATQEPQDRRHRPPRPDKPERPDALPKPYPYVRAVPNNVPVAPAQAAGYPPLVIMPPVHHRPPVVVVEPPAQVPISQGPPFQPGYALPEAYRHPIYYLHDWQHRPGLYPPPAGYQWVRIGNEVLLISPQTGYIAQRLVF